jgi:hypothetical protein
LIFGNEPFIAGALVVAGAAVVAGAEAGAADLGSSFFPQAAKPTTVAPTAALAKKSRRCINVSSSGCSHVMPDG